MSLPIPLTVRLRTARADRHIERDLRSLSFRSVAPGGFASAQFSLDRPLASSPDEIAYYANVYVYDARNGQTVWEGRLEDPDRGVGSDGQIWDIAATGPSAHAHDRRKDYIVIDKSLDRWERDSASKRAGRTDTELDDDDNDDESPSLVATWSEGMTAVQDDFIRFLYYPIRRAGQKLARVYVEIVNPVNDPGATLWEDRLVTRASGSFDVVDQAGWSTTTHNLAASVGGATPITNGHNRAFIQSHRTGATAAIGDLTRYSRYKNVVVRALMLEKDGTEDTGPYNNNWVNAHGIVHDLLGRFLTQYDGANAVVDSSSTFQIEQAAWPDGVTPAEVLEDLMVLEPTKYWAAWESNSDGKHRFEWRSWPTMVRYEADVTDGFNSPGSAEGLYNAVTIRWRGAKAAIRSRRRTQTVDVLDDAGLIREELLDLGDNIGSFNAALQAGEQFLAEHQVPPNAGTLTVARPIYDHVRGHSVMPWEIRPGHLIRVRGVQPNPNSLNMTSRDGVTVFRIVAHDYDTASASASLELDSHSRTVARALADLKSGLRNRRRR